MTFVVLCIIIIRFVFLNLERKPYEESLYKEKIEGEIVKVEERNRGGYIYYYNDSFFWASDFMENRKQILRVGDSVFKEPKSLELKVYRKSLNGRYLYYKTFIGKI